MKFFFFSTLFLALAAYAQTGAVGTPTGTGAGSGANIGTAPTQNPSVGTYAPRVEPSVLAPNPAVTPIPRTNPDGSVNTNTIGPYYPNTMNSGNRQSQEVKPAPLPGQPSAYPPINNPGQPSNVDRSGRPIVP